MLCTSTFRMRINHFPTHFANFHKNRVELTLNYDNSEIDFADTDTSLDDLLGFTGRGLRVCVGGGEGEGGAWAAGCCVAVASRAPAPS
eukprot:COSAG06_NODE_412_length_16042_cov_52.419934_3_plen_88_part_00